MWAALLALVLLLGAGGLALSLADTGPATNDGAVLPDGAREQRTVHVAADGDDTAEGTAAAPKRTLQAAVTESEAGDTIMVHAGTYHEELKIENRPGLRVVAAPGAEVWLDGSVVVPAWSRDGELWVSRGWSAEFDSSPTYSWGQQDGERHGWSFVSPEYPLAAHPDQVWIDGERQVQVGSRAEVRPGTFYVDYEHDDMFLGSDPTGRTVTASAQARALRILSAGVLVRGIGIRKYAPSVPHMGALTVEAPDVTLEHVALTDNATTGMHVLSKGVKLHDVTLERNGMMGLSATEADGLELVRVMVRDNNLERFNKSPAAGGAKIGRSSEILIQDSVFAGNLGNGLWFDESVYGVTLLQSHVLDNSGHGVSIEVSGHATVMGNVIARNAGNGLKLNDSEDVRVWNNTFVDNVRSINVVQDNRDVDPGGTYRDPELPLRWQTQGIAIRNNVIAATGATQGGADRSRTCLLCVEDFSGRWTAAEMNVTALGNVYQRPDATSPKWMVVWARRDKDPYVFRTVEDFRATVHQEETGVQIIGTSVLSDDFRPAPALEHLYGSVAQPLPDDLAQLAGRPVGDRHLGAWGR
jgi:parallel beta-helix repeat protein